MNGMSANSTEQRVKTAEARLLALESPRLKRFLAIRNMAGDMLANELLETGAAGGADFYLEMIAQGRGAPGAGKKGFSRRLLGMLWLLSASPDGLDGFLELAETDGKAARAIRSAFAAGAGGIGQAARLLAFGLCERPFGRLNNLCSRLLAGAALRGAPALAPFCGFAAGLGKNAWNGLRMAEGMAKMSGRARRVLAAARLRQLGASLELLDRIKAARLEFQGTLEPAVLDDWIMLSLQGDWRFRRVEKWAFLTGSAPDEMERRLEKMRGRGLAKRKSRSWKINTFTEDGRN